MNLFVYVGLEDATTFYRADQPIAQLRHLMCNLNIFYAGKEIRKRDLAHMDVCFIQRPSGPEHLALIRLCKALGVKTWIDYDDNLFCVPVENPASHVYESEQTKACMKECINQADAVSVSTSRLALDLNKLTGRGAFEVIPNALNDFILTDVPVFKPHNLIFWRGTQSHQRDLAEFGNEIASVAHEHPKWLFNFMGFKPWFLLDTMGKQMSYTAPTDILEYHEFLHLIYPNIMMVPLSDQPFNRAKSNIAWIEATYGGAVTLAPAWDEWKKPGVITYDSIQDFGHSLKTLIETPSQDLMLAHAESWKYIDQNLRLSKVNSERAFLLEMLA